MARLTFWFEFASTYSYLSAMRIEEMARKADVEVIWKPFLLGPIFKAQNWDTSPFNIYPAKGRYMVRDIGRIAEARGLVFRLPDPFPQNGLLAARLAVVGLEDGWGHSFNRFSGSNLRSSRISRGNRRLRQRLRLRGLPKTKPSSEPSRPKSKASCAPTQRRRRYGAFSAPQVLQPKAESCSGETTG